MGERSEEVDSDFLSHSSLGISSAESSAYPHCADIHAINNEGKCFRHSEDIAPVLYSLHTNQEDLRSEDWRAFGPPHASSSRKSAASIEDGDENTSHFTIISNLKAIVSSAFLLQTPDRGEHRSSVEDHWNDDIYRQRWAECASEVRLSYRWIHKASVLVASFVIAELRRLLVSTMFVLLVSCVTGVVVQFAAAGLLCALGLWQHIEPFLHGLPSVRYNVLLGALALPHIPWSRTHVFPTVMFAHVILVWFTGALLHWTMLAVARLVGLQAVGATLGFLLELIVYYSIITFVFSSCWSDYRRCITTTRGSAIALIGRVLARACILYLIETNCHAKSLITSLIQEALCVFTGGIALNNLPKRCEKWLEQFLLVLKRRMGHK